MIDIGAEAIKRTRYAPSTRTIIGKDNPANASGIITSIEIWAYLNLIGCVVGTFYLTNSNTLKCRDSVEIGDVVAGSKQTFQGLSLTVEAGDYIGYYFDAGTGERSLAGYDGLWQVSGKYIDPGDEAVYSLFSGDAISLHGIGGNIGNMTTSHKKRPDGSATAWSWVDAERTLAFHHDLAGGESTDMAAIMGIGAMSQDIHVDKVVVSLENAPSAGSTVTVTADNGVSTITVNVADLATSGSSTTNHFDLDVSTQALTIQISATAGTAAGCVTIFVFYHDITIT